MKNLKLGSTALLLKSVLSNTELNIVFQFGTWGDLVHYIGQMFKYTGEQLELLRTRFLTVRN